MLVGSLVGGQTVSAQIYVKLNGLYALAGVSNPAVEFTLSPKSTFQTEIVYSPWQYVRDRGVNKPMHFAIFMNEYRRYFKKHNSGWYLGANMGKQGFIWKTDTAKGMESCWGFVAAMSTVLRSAGWLTPISGGPIC